MSVEHFTDLGYLVKATRHAFGLVRELCQVSTHPEGISHDGMHRLATCGVNRKFGGIHIGSTVLSLILRRGIGIIGQRPKHAPACGSQVERNLKWALLKSRFKKVGDRLPCPSPTGVVTII